VICCNRPVRRGCCDSPALHGRRSGRVRTLCMNTPRLICRFLILLLVLLPGGLLAQSPPDAGVTLLLPLATDLPISGSFDSVWLDQLYVHNDDTEPAVIRVSESRTQAIPPGMLTVISFPSTVARTDGRPWLGRWLTMDRETFSRLSFHFELTGVRRGFAGVIYAELPVVSLESFASEPIHLFRIPGSEWPDTAETRDGVRSTVRVYGLPGSAGKKVLVRIFVVQLQTPPLEYVLTLQGSDDPVAPPYAEFSGFPEMNHPMFSPLFRVELTPISEGLRIWAIASSTLNGGGGYARLQLFTPQPGVR